MRFDTKLKGSNIEIDIENNSAEKTKDQEFENACLDHCIESGIYHFKFKLLRRTTIAGIAGIYSGGLLNIGIWFIGDSDINKYLNGYLLNNFYAYVATEGKLLQPRNDFIHSKLYGVRCEDNVEIEMIVDFNALTIKYVIEGVDHGIAYQDISVGKYRPVVLLHRKGACVQLSNYSVTA